MGAQYLENLQTLMKMRNCLKQPTYTIATQKENRAKNRNPNALPGRQQSAYSMHEPARN